MKILVVDNNQLILEFINNLLTKEGHQVATAKDGLCALDILIDYTPDFIFIDLVMPNIDGKKLCQIIRDKEKLKNTRIAILSAIAVEEKSEIAEMGADVCIAKGPLQDMALHILSAIQQTDLKHSRRPSLEFKGFGNIHPREISKELLLVKRHFEIILERMSEGILEIGPERRIVYCNPISISLTGLPEESLLSSDFVEIFPKDERRRIQELLETTDRTSKARPNRCLVNLNGRRVVINITSVNDESPTLIAILNDVTDWKNAEEALRESEERYRSLVENTLDGYFISEIPSGRFLFLNQRCCDLYGYTMQEGQELTIWDVMSSEDHRRIKERIKARIEGKRLSSERQVYTAVRKDGSTFRAEISASLVTFYGGSAAQGVLRDITEQERLSQQLQQAQKMEAVGTLAGGIAHDFNNLLMAIQGNASLMIMKTASGHPYYENLKNIEKCVQSGGELTRQLLGFARGGKYEIKPTDLNEMIRTCSEMFARTKKEIAIHSKLQEDIWMAEVDRGQINQMLLNLYVNAWQAMPKGGRMFIETENVTLDGNRLKAFNVKSGRYIEISITDTGEGMDEETRTRIFEPFFTTKEMNRGAGLGLASVYGVVKGHEGYILVDSQKGRGTTFTIYLPASEKQAIERMASPPKVRKGEGTILLVDDEDIIIEVVKPMLEELGYRVYTAGSGKEAIELYETHRDEIDMVILDMIMPQMSGEEVFMKLKEMNPQIKVLLSSGYSIEGHAKDILKKGCDGFIQKPYDTKQLSHQIGEILEA